MAAVIGNLSVFDYKVQDWQIFYGRLAQFLKLNKIPAESERAVLLTHLSDESYRLVINLVHPRKVEDVDYGELVNLLNSHFTPKRSTFADRAKFYEATRGDGESVEDWAVRLRGLAVYCDFGTSLDTVLRDRFVLGLKAGPERDRLFEQDAKALTLAKAMEVAQQVACARAARAPPSIKEEPVYRVEERRAAAPVAARRTPALGDSGPRCKVCGLKNHDAVRCRYRGYRCQSCGEKGHLKKVCAAKSPCSSQMHCIGVDSEASGGSDCKECQVFNMRYVSYAPIIVDVTVNNVVISMELDSGSGTTVISDKLYREHFSNLRLEQCNIKMCLYNGHKITPLGFFLAGISYSGLLKELQIYVVNNCGPPLLGRDFMNKFNIKIVCDNMNIISAKPCQSGMPQFLSEFSELWNDELGRFNKFKVNLQLKEGVEPKFFKPRSVPFALKDRVDDEIERLVGLGILVPVNYSRYATPIVPVLKENGKVKIAGDFSLTLNKDLYIDKYPMPRIEEVFANLSNGEQYTKIDLSNAYNQFVLEESSQQLTTISTTKGLFKYTRLVYGLANAPAIFQRAMEALLMGIDGVSCWLDDVCVTGPTRDIHTARLREVLTRMRDAGLRLQKEKCSFFQNSVTYLGYVIDKMGLRACPKKTEAIAKAPCPTNVVELKRFLGIVNYYRNFIPQASNQLGPLHELLRDGSPWQWGERQQCAFDAVKSELSSERVLAHFDPTAQLVLAVDAGPGGLGAVLAQRTPDGQERPLSFASRSLSTSERNYSQIQKEATAIIFGVKKYHQFLYGRQEPFILKTDHRPLLSIFGKKVGISVMAASRLQRYAIILSAYNYTVQYINSADNLVADYFSRAPLPAHVNNDKGVEERSFLMFLDANVVPISFETIKEATKKDAVLQTVIKYMKQGWPRKISCDSIKPYFACKGDLEVENECLFRGHRVVIPLVFRATMLKELHSGHLGIVKTKTSARSRMWWPGIDAEIEHWIGACALCAVARAAPPRAPPAPWPRPAGAWQRVHIDYMTVGQQVYLVVIDAYSKWLECILMNCGTSTHALILKLKYLFSRFGIPNVIVSDNDVKINSSEFRDFCANNGIRYVTSPIYHPSSNGQAENSVKTCKKMLKCILIENSTASPESVANKLLGFLFDYRNTLHCASGDTPAKLMLGRDLRSRLDLVLPEKGLLVENKKSCLSKRRQLEIGDEVWLRWFVSRKETWTTGEVVKVIGNRMFEVLVHDTNVVCRRHLDQLIRYSGGAFAGGQEMGKASDGMVAAPTSPPSPPPLPTPPGPSASPPGPSSPGPSSPVETRPGASFHGGQVEQIELSDGCVKQRDRENVEGEEDEWAEAREEAAPEPCTQVEPPPAGGEGRSLRIRKKVNYKAFF